MIHRTVTVLVFVLFAPSVTIAFPWPGKQPGKITGVLGEQRELGNGTRFHNGIDIAEPYKNGFEIYSIHSGYCVRSPTAAYIRSDANPASFQLAGYIHISPTCRSGRYVIGLVDETPSNQALSIGTVPGNHLHLILGSGLAAGLAGGSENALTMDGGLDDYEDFAPPIYEPENTTFCRDVREDDDDGMGNCAPRNRRRLSQSHKLGWTEESRRRFLLK